MAERILVTGGSGYIGFNLVKNLQGYTVDVLDRQERYTPVDYLGDINEMELPNIEYDCIVHLAALPGVKACEENPEQSHRDNVQTVETLQNKYPGTPFIFISSQAAKQPAANIYAKHKAEAEAATLSPSIILRLSNVYGGDNYLEAKDTVLARFVRAYREHYPLTLYGSGHQQRDYINVNDVCLQIGRAIRRITDKRFGGMEVFDIASGHPLTLWELVSIFPDDAYVRWEGSVDPGVSTVDIDLEPTNVCLGCVCELLEDWIHGQVG